MLCIPFFAVVFCFCCLFRVAGMTWKVWGLCSCTSCEGLSPGRDSRPTRKNKNTRGFWSASSRPTPTCCASTTPRSSRSTSRTALRWASRTVLTTGAVRCSAALCWAGGARFFSLFICLFACLFAHRFLKRIFKDLFDRAGYIDDGEC